MHTPSQQLHREILRKYPFIDAKEFQNATEKALLALEKKTRDPIFGEYLRKKKWDAEDDKKRKAYDRLSIGYI